MNHLLQGHLVQGCGHVAELLLLGPDTAKFELGLYRREPGHRRICPERWQLQVRHVDSWWRRGRELRRLHCVEAVRWTAITVVVVILVVDEWGETSGVVVQCSCLGVITLEAVSNLY